MKLKFNAQAVLENGVGLSTVFGAVHRWLKPGGVVLAATAKRSAPGATRDQAVAASGICRTMTR